VEDLQEALQICQDCRFSADLHRNLGLIYCRQGNIESGKRELQHALKLNPNDGDALKAIETLEAAPNSKSVAR
jgi:tetratricopeptide (TPR) repeat protein